MKASKKILVTGGAGYIGSHTVVELIQNGFEPIILDDFRNSHRSAIEGLSKITNTEITVREVDVCDYSALKAVFEEFSFSGIIHFAAYKAVGESVEEPLKYYRNNIVGLINCLEFAQEFGVENFVFSSSCTVYGERKGVSVVTEVEEMQPANAPYGNTKQIGEQIIRDFVQNETGVKILSLRYFNPVGAHPSSLIGELPLGKPNNLFPIVAQTASGKIKQLMVNGSDYSTKDGTCVRDYVHVSDVADAHVKGIDWLQKQEGTFAEVVNIGTGKGTSILEIIHTFEEISGIKLNWTFGPRREGDIQEIYAGVEKSKNLLNWESKRTVREAIQDAWNWEQQLKE